MARLDRGKSPARPRLVLAKELGGDGAGAQGPARPKRSSIGSRASWPPLAPLRQLEDAARDPEAGSEVRALVADAGRRQRHDRPRAGGPGASAQGEAPVPAQARGDDRLARRIRTRAAPARAAPAAARDRRATGARSTRAWKQ